MTAAARFLLLAAGALVASGCGSSSPAPTTCATAACAAQATCDDSSGRAVCTCLPGYADPHGDGTSCTACPSATGPAIAQCDPATITQCSDSFLIAATGQAASQSFRATSSGPLDHLRLRVLNTLGGDGYRIEVSLVPGGPAADSVPPTLSAIQSTRLASTTTVATSSLAWQEIRFSPEPILASGARYFIVLRLVSDLPSPVCQPMDPAPPAACTGRGGWGLYNDYSNLSVPYADGYAFAGTDDLSSWFTELSYRVNEFEVVMRSATCRQPEGVLVR